MEHGDRNGAVEKRRRRIAVMGFRGVGKSAITIQFVEQHFQDTYDPTIEATFRRDIEYRGHTYALEITDTMGQDEYTGLTDMYTHLYDGYIFVYSVTLPKSLDVALSVWTKICDHQGKQNIPAILVANKVDLQMDRRVSKHEGEQLAQRMGNIPWKETSAKSNQDITEVFIALLCAIEKSYGNTITPEQTKQNGCVIA